MPRVPKIASVPKKHAMHGSTAESPEWALHQAEEENRDFHRRAANIARIANDVQLGVNEAINRRNLRRGFHNVDPRALTMRGVRLSLASILEEKVQADLYREVQGNTFGQPHDNLHTDVNTAVGADNHQLPVPDEDNNYQASLNADYLNQNLLTKAGRRLENLGRGAVAMFGGNNLVEAEVERRFGADRCPDHRQVFVVERLRNDIEAAYNNTPQNGVIPLMAVFGVHGAGELIAVLGQASFEELRNLRRDFPNEQWLDTPAFCDLLILTKSVDKHLARSGMDRVYDHQRLRRFMHDLHARGGDDRRLAELIDDMLEQNSLFPLENNIDGKALLAELEVRYASLGAGPLIKELEAIRKEELPPVQDTDVARRYADEKAELTDLKKEVTSVLEEMRVARLALQEATKANADLEKERKKRVENESKDLESRLDLVRSERDKLDKQENDLQQRLMGNDVDNFADITALEDKKISLALELEGAQREHEDLEKNLKDRQERLTKNQTELNNAKQALKQLIEDQKVVSSMFDESNRKVDELEADIQLRAKNLEPIEKKCQFHLKRKGEIQQWILIYEKQIAEFNEKVRLATTLKDKGNLEVQLKNKQDALEKLRNQALEADAYIADLQKSADMQELLAKQNALAQEKDTLMNLVNKVNNANDSVNNMQGVVSKLETLCDDPTLQKEIKTLEKNVIRSKSAMKLLEEKKIREFSRWDAQIDSYKKKQGAIQIILQNNWQNFLATYRPRIEKLYEEERELMGKQRELKSKGEGASMFESDREQGKLYAENLKTAQKALTNCDNKAKDLVRKIDAAKARNVLTAQWGEMQSVTDLLKSPELTKVDNTSFDANIKTHVDDARKVFERLYDELHESKTTPFVLLQRLMRRDYYAARGLDSAVFNTKFNEEANHYALVKARLRTKDVENLDLIRSSNDKAARYRHRPVFFRALDRAADLIARGQDTVGVEIFAMENFSEDLMLRHIIDADPEFGVFKGVNKFTTTRDLRDILNKSGQNVPAVVLERFAQTVKEAITKFKKVQPHLYNGLDAADWDLENLVVVLQKLESEIWSRKFLAQVEADGGDGEREQSLIKALKGARAADKRLTADIVANVTDSDAVWRKILVKNDLKAILNKERLESDNKIKQLSVDAKKRELEKWEKRVIEAGDDKVAKQAAQSRVDNLQRQISQLEAQIASSKDLYERVEEARKYIRENKLSRREKAEYLRQMGLTEVFNKMAVNFRAENAWGHTKKAVKWGWEKTKKAWAWSRKHVINMHRVKQTFSVVRLAATPVTWTLSTAGKIAALPFRAGWWVASGVAGLPGRLWRSLSNEARVKYIAKQTRNINNEIAKIDEKQAKLNAAVPEAVFSWDKKRLLNKIADLEEKKQAWQRRLAKIQASGNKKAA